MNIYLAFFLWTAFGFLCMRIARKKNRNPYLWFIGGFFFTIFALAIILFLPHKDSSDETSLNLQKARPSEDAPHEINPEEAEALEEQAREIEALGQSKEKSLPEDQKLWYYLDSENKQQGPMTFQGLTTAWYDRKIKATTYVWNEELEDWKPFKSLSEFKNLQNPNG